MTQVKTQEIQENTSGLRIQSTYTLAVTNLAAGVTLWGAENQIVTMFGQQRVLDQVKISGKWIAGEEIPKPFIQVMSFGVLKSGKPNDRQYKTYDYDARYMDIGLTPELLAEGIARYYEKARETVEEAVNAIAGIRS